MAMTMQEKVDKLRAEIKKLGLLESERQHGRKGVKLNDINKELEREYHNLHSVLYRARKKMMLKSNQADTVNKALSEANISQADIRRFKGCFVYESIKPEMSYVKMMTGLNDYQIGILEDYVGLKVAHKKSS